MLAEAQISAMIEALARHAMILGPGRGLS